MIKEFDRHDFIDINQLSKEFLDNFRTTSNEVIDSDSPKVRFNAKLFKKVQYVLPINKKILNTSRCHYLQS